MIKTVSERTISMYTYPHKVTTLFFNVLMNAASFSDLMLLVFFMSLYVVVSDVLRF